MATAPKAEKVVPIAAADKKNSSKKTMGLVVALIAVILAAASGAYAVFGNGSAEPSVSAPKPPAPPVYHPLETFTVNLQPEFGEQYLQVAMTLQVANTSQIDQIKLYMPLVRSRILMLLSSKKPSEISTPAGKQQLQSEIVETLRIPFSQNGQEIAVTDVLFTAFVIQ